MTLGIKNTASCDKFYFAGRVMNKSKKTNFILRARRNDEKCICPLFRSHFLPSQSSFLLISPSFDSDMATFG